MRAQEPERDHGGEVRGAWGRLPPAADAVQGAMFACMHGPSAYKFACTTVQAEPLALEQRGWQMVKHAEGLPSLWGSYRGPHACCF